MGTDTRVGGLGFMANGYKVYLGEIGMYAGNESAAAAWADYVNYFNANVGPIVGFTGWGCGMPN